MHGADRRSARLSYLLVLWLQNARDSGIIAVVATIIVVLVWPARRAVAAGHADASELTHSDQPQTSA